MTDRVYLGLGSNLGDSCSTIQQAISAIAAIPGVFHLKASRLFQTTPVSAIPQNDYINAAVCLETTLDAHALHQALKRTEDRLGKRPKAKAAPRELDIDILLFGRQRCDTPDLLIPHPRWKERLFVLLPLLDLAEEILLPSGETLNLKEFLKTFPNTHRETVFPLI